MPVGGATIFEDVLYGILEELVKSTDLDRYGKAVLQIEKLIVARLGLTTYNLTTAEAIEKAVRDELEKGMSTSGAMSFTSSDLTTWEDSNMRYDIRRWYADQPEGGTLPTLLEDCERLEVVKQVIKAIDNAENFEAIVSGPEREEVPTP